MATISRPPELAHDPLDSPPLIPEQGSEISFAELFGILSRRRRSILFPTIAAAVCAVVTAFLIPPKFTAEAVILTPQQPPSSFSTMAQLAGGGGNNIGMSGLSLLAGFGLRNPSDLYVGMLESRTIADSLIDRFKLKQVYDDSTYQKARKHLARATSIKAGKDTLIHIKVEDGEPQRAAQLANAYVDELSTRNSAVALTEASQRRLFFEQQVAKEKDLLAKAEVALRDTEQVTGLMVPTGQAEALIRSASQLRAELLSRQAQVEGMKSYVSEDNPRFQAVKREIATLQSELAALEHGTQNVGALDLPVGKIPAAGLEYVRKYRDVRYHESLYEALAKQYEAARLDEAKSAPLIQIVDSAVVPERRSWPPRTVIVLATLVLAAAISTLVVLLVEGGFASRSYR